MTPGNQDGNQKGEHDFGEELEEALRRRADTAGLVPASLGEVQRKARDIRRRRTAVGVLGAAATVAVLAGVGVAIVPGSDDHGAPPPTSATPTPTASPSPTSASPSPATPSGTASGHVRTFTVDLDDVHESMGPALRIPNWSDGQLVDGNGGHAIPVKDRPESPVLDGSTWYAMTEDQTTGIAQWTTYATDGSIAHTDQAGSAKVAITPDGRTYAVVLADGGIGKRLVVAGAQHWETALGAGDGWEVAGILPDGNVVVGDAQGRTVVVHPDGRQKTISGTTPQAVSPSSGAIVVRTRDLTDQQRSCWALVDESGKRVSKETCDYTPTAFSADGAGLLAMDSGADNISEGVGRLQLLDPSTLAPVASFTAAKGTALYVDQAAWMGDTLVMPVRGPAKGAESWGLALLSRDGVQVIAQAIRPARGTVPPWSFGAGPLTIR